MQCHHVRRFAMTMRRVKVTPVSGRSRISASLFRSNTDRPLGIPAAGRTKSLAKEHKQSKNAVCQFGVVGTGPWSFVFTFDFIPSISHHQIVHCVVVQVS